MTTLGKVFLVLNVLAAAAVVYFATDNWSKRQSLNAIGLRYAITLRGLPTTPQPGQQAAFTNEPAADAIVGVRLPNGTGGTAEEVTYRLLKEHFSAADGKAPFGSNLPPLSVTGEATRVKEAVYKYLAAPADAASRAGWNPSAQQVEEGLTWLCGRIEANGSFTPGLLARLANDYGERQVVRRLVAPPASGEPIATEAMRKESLVKALAMLDKRFAAITENPNPSAAEDDVARATVALKAITDARDEIYVPALGGGAERGAVAQEGAARVALITARANLAADSKNPDLKTAVANAERDVLTASLRTDEARKKLTAAVNDYESLLTNVGLGASRDDADRRRRAILLLSHLDFNAPDTAWQKRMMLLFGQPAYVSSQLDRINALKPYGSISAAAESAANAEFILEYERLKNIAIRLDDAVERQKALRAEAEGQLKSAGDILAKREEYRNGLKAIADELTQQLKSLADAQEISENELFALQSRAGRLLRENFDLEDRLIRAERQAVPPVGR